MDRADMSEYFGTFTGEDARLFKLACEYHERCEAFDRTVCTGPIVRGSILPMTHHERAQVNRNAHAVLDEIITRGAAMGFTRLQIQREISRNA